EPDVLLLDEPSNHLDEAGKAWLVRAARGFEGVGVIVSHDRGLLDALTEQTLRLHRRTLELWAGSYSAAKELWDQQAAHSLQQRRQLQQDQRRVARQLDSARRDQAAADAQRSNRKAMRNEHDHDARSLGQKTLVAWAEKRHGRRVEVLREKESKASAAVDAL